MEELIRIIKKGKYTNFEYRGGMSIYSGKIKKVYFNDSIMNIEYNYFHQGYNELRHDEFDLSTIDEINESDGIIQLIVHTKSLRLNQSYIKDQVLILKRI